MGLFDLFASRKIKALEDENLQLKKLSQNIAVQNIISSFNRAVAVYPSQDITKYAQRYTTNDDIYSLIRLLSTTAARVPLYGYEVTKDEEKSFKLLKRTSYLKREYKNIQKKALTDLDETDLVSQLLERPNSNMGKFQFYVELYSWLYLDGEVFLRKQRPDTGKNQGLPMELSFWNPTFVIPNISQTYPKTIISFNYEINGWKLEENIPASEVIHIKYWNPYNTDDGSELRGLSPIKVLTRRLTSLDSNMDRTVAHLQNSGVETIVYDKSLVDAGNSAVEIMDNRKSNFYRHISNSSNAGAPYFSVGEMGAINIGSHLSEMGVIDLAKVDFKKLCNSYGVSDRLFNNDATGSEISDDNARKGLYTVAILPNVFMVRDALINHLLPDFSEGVRLEEPEVIRIPGDGKKRYIDADLSDIKELSDDISKQVTALAAASWLTPNEKREAMEYERYDDPLFDEPLIPTGLVPLSDLTLPEPELTNEPFRTEPGSNGNATRG